MKKKLIIIVAALLLLAGGGGAAWWFLLRGPSEEVVAEEKPPEEETQVFYELEPMVVPVLRDGQVIQHMTMLVILEMTDEDAMIEAKRQILWLRDAFRVEMNGMLSHRIIQGRDDVMPLFSKRLMTQSEKVLGPGLVKKVLVNVMDQRDLGEV